MTEKIKGIIQASIDVKTLLLADEEVLRKTAAVADLMTRAFRQGNRAFFCGNGGSAADAQHLAAELSGRFYTDRHALPAEALHANTSYLTAVANDYSYEMVYERLVHGIMQKGDILVGLSTSGNSANIVRAFEAAREKGVITIGFTGQTGGILKSESDYLFNIPSADTPRIQEAHMLLGHIVCQLIEEQYFSKEAARD
ncbi:MAG: SIS domain-containing protein [Williamsia sp.]|nr:SIS domain-containing protein [Williamsia sp.]